MQVLFETGYTGGLGKDADTYMYRLYSDINIYYRHIVAKQKLGGGNSNIFFVSSLFGEDSHFD